MSRRTVEFGCAIVIIGLLAGVAGMVFTAYLNAANPKDGVGFELDAIAAVFVGGAAVSGGIGTVNASIIGGLVMSFLQNGLFLVGAGSSQQQVIRGLVLLLAVGVDVYSKTQGRPSLTGRLLGSVPADVARQSDCDVMIVHTVD